MGANRSVEKISWMPHPTAPGVKIKPLISQKEHGLDVTCMLVSVPVGKEVAEHTHENQDDVLYPIRGKSTMWVDGTGDFSLEPGVIVRVPKGTKHKITEVSEDLLIYDVFCPALI
ncbi:MAG: cupin domain-containing protein [Deltaproteobacteria bacterium]|nr:MAG: cupin domain-containing protein [Deltaproteobacteria bacterium]